MNYIPTFDKLDDIDAAIKLAVDARTINKRKWAVEFYFSPTNGAQVLFRSESMPRKNAERVMDELMDRKGIVECWLQDMGPIKPSAGESDSLTNEAWNEIDPLGQEMP